MEKDSIKYTNYVIAFLIGVIFGLFIGAKFIGNDNNKSEEKKVEITSRTILKEISQESFLITQSALINQYAKKAENTDGWWSRLWLKDEVRAEALVRVDIGIDFKDLREEHIIIDNTAKTVKIALPKAKIYKSYLIDDLKVETKNGIITKFTRNKDNDYNNAIKQLQNEAIKSIEKNTDIFDNARKIAFDTIQLLLKDFEYKVELVEQVAESTK